MNRPLPWPVLTVCRSFHKILDGDFWNHASGEFQKPAFHEILNRLIIALKISRQGQNRRHDAQTIIRLSHGQSSRNAAALAAREHQSRMRRDAKERAMVPAGIETTHVKVPAMRGQDNAIILD